MHNHGGENNPMYGKKQKTKTKKLISKKARLRLKIFGHPGKDKNKENSERYRKTSETLKKLYASGKAKCGFKKGYVPPNKKYFDNRYAYTRIAFENLLSRCNRCKNKDLRVLEVHHKDRNRKNNKIENLEILCANCHKIEHLKDKKLSTYKK